MARLRKLLDRYRTKNDLRAFAAVFDATAPELLRIAVHLTGDPALAEDLVQETFRTLISKAGEFDASLPVAPWLTGILRNHARNLQRREQRRRTSPTDSERGEATDLGAALDGLEWSNRIAGAVATLPDMYRTPLVLRLRHGLSPAEIAEVLGKAPGTVRSLLHRGLGMLRDRLPAASRPPALVALPALGGLTGVRTQVLAGVGLAAPATAATATGIAGAVSGALVMNKISPWLAAVAVSLLLVGIGFGTGLFDLHDEPESGRRNAMLVTEDDQEGPTLAARPDAEPAATPPEVAPGPPPPVDLELVDRARDLHGRVQDESGKAVANAEIVATRSVWRESGFFNRGRDPKVEVGRLRSAVDGTFAIPLDVGSLASLRVEAEGFATASFGGLQPGERLEITMRRPAELEVLVTGLRGESISNAHVEVHSKYTVKPLRLLEKGTTDDEGVARFSGLPAGLELQVIARVRTEGLGIPPDVQLTLEADKPAKVTMECGPGMSVRGRVLSAESGRPIEGARVRGPTWRAPSDTTDVDGKFHIYGLTADTGRVVTATASGYVRGKAHAEPGEAVEIRLARAARILGKIVDEQGRPIAGARLNAIGSDFGPLGQRLSTAAATTDAEGHFVLESLNPEMAHTLVVAAAGFGRRLFDTDAVAPALERDTGQLVLGPAHEIRGVVRNADGTPAGRLDVVVKGANPDRAKMRKGGAGVAQEHYGDELSRSTDDLGRFLFPDISEGTYRVIVGRGARESSAPVVVERGASPEPLEINLAGIRTIEVRVLDDDDAPVPGVYVSALSPSAGLMGVGGSTNSEGLARFDAPLGEHLRISVRVRGKPYAPVRGVLMRAQETELTVRVKRASQTKGVLLDPEGKPISGATLFALHEGKRVGWSRTDSDGRFSFSIEPGLLVNIRFSGHFAQIMGGSVKQGMLPLVAGQDGVASGTTEIRLVARRDPKLKSLSVRVLTPDGKPMQAYVRIGEHGMPTGNDGWAHAHNLPDEAVEVRASDNRVYPLPYLSPASRKIRPAGQEVEFRMRRGHVIDGVLVGPNGERVAGGRIEALQGGEVIDKALALDDGRFRFVFETTVERIDEIRVTHKLGGATHTGTLRDVPVGKTDVELELAPTGG